MIFEGIGYYKSAIDEKIISDVLSRSSNLEFTKNDRYNQVDSMFESCYLNNDEDIDLRRVSLNILENYLKDIKIDRLLGITDFIIESSSVDVIKKGTSLPIHFDNDNKGFRYFLFLVYLNKLDDGQLIFPRQDLVITPTPGSVVIIPTTYLFPHMVMPSKYDRYTYHLNFERKI